MKADGTPKEWLAWLTGRDSRQRHEAKLILGGLEPKDVIGIDPLIRGLGSEDRDVAFWSTVGLGRLGRQAAAAIPNLAGVAVGHREFGVRQAAVSALAWVGPRDDQAKAAVLQALGDTSPWVRRDALEALIHFEDLTEHELTRIKAMESDPDEDVARWSEIALRNIRLNDQ
jgi:HEAT repeat protein